MTYHFDMVDSLASFIDIESDQSGLMRVRVWSNTEVC